jgi:hypothetical protein
MPSVDKRVPFQQVTIEYRVVGELDGTTLAPNVVLDPNSEGYNEPDIRGIHVVDVPGNLGLIDPDLIGSAAQGDRCIPWFYIDTNGVGGAPDATIAVVDNVDRGDGIVVPVAQYIRFDTGGVPVFYSDRSTYVPQGSALSIAGYDGGSVKLVRLNIVAPHDALEFANMLEACCCSAVVCEDPPEIDGLDEPLMFSPGTTDVTFNSDDLVEEDSPPSIWLVQESDSTKDPDSGGSVPGIYLSNVPGVSVTFRFDVLTGETPGNYAPVWLDPQDPSCNNAGQDPDPPTIVIWPEDCPVLDDPMPGAPNILVDGGGDQAFTVSGQNFAGPTVSEIRLVHQETGVEIAGVTFVTDSDIQLTVTASPDATGFYDMIMVPIGAGCPTQKVIHVVTAIVC